MPEYPLLPDEVVCYCPVCRAILGMGDTVYRDPYGYIVGCEECLTPIQAYEMYEKVD